MRKLRYVLGILLAITGAAATPTTEPHVPDDAFKPAEIIVQLDATHSAGMRARLDADAKVVGARTGVATLDRLNLKHRVRDIRPVLGPRRDAPDPQGRTPIADYFIVRLGEAKDPREVLAEYRRDPAVKSAQLNYRYEPDAVPNDPYYPQQWAHPATSAPAGWDIETGEPSIVIAIIGQGVQTNHQDLKNNIVAGYDFIDGDNNPNPAPLASHETMVAGIAAAIGDNNKGVAGVCWRCSIMPLRTSMFSANLVTTMDYAITHGARVINISYSIGYPDALVEAAVNDADAHQVVVTASAGNFNLEFPIGPAAFENALGVAATEAGDARAPFSNFGSWVDVSAPGNVVWTTTLGNAYTSNGGTSFSAPYAAGLAGLILSKNPSLTAANVRHMIEYSADHIATDRYIGGRVNVLRALQLNGEPTLYALIKAPDPGTIVDAGSKQVFGTSLGSSYVLEYKPQATSTWTPFGSGTTLTNEVLGSFDATPLTFGRYDLRLTATLGGSQDQHQTSFFRGSTYPQHSGWPQTLSLNSPVGLSPLLADLNRDGSMEVVVSSGLGQIGVWSAAGSPLPGWIGFGVGSAAVQPAAVGNIEGSADLEVVVASNAGLVHAFHADATSVPNFPLTMDSAPAGPPVLANLDADPALEIVAVSVNGRVYVWNGDGSSFGAAWPKIIDSPVDAPPAVGDINKDGTLDIVVRQSLKVYAFKADGTALSGWPVTTSSTSYGVAPVIGDLDGNGTVEIVETEQLENSGRSVVAYNSNGTVLWRQDFSGTILNALSLGDLDNNGTLETFVTDQAGRVLAYNSSGAPLQNFPVTAMTKSAIKGAALIADVDGDGYKDVLAGDSTGRVHGWDRNGALILLTATFGAGMKGTPAVGDMDGDGNVELLGTSENPARVGILDLPGPYVETSMAWPMARGDAQRTGHHCLPVVIDVIARPSFDAGPNDGSPSPAGGNHCAYVDEDPHDGDTTTLSFASPDTREVFETTDELLPTDLVTNVKVRWVAKRGSGSGWRGRVGVKVSASESLGPDVALPLNYTVREDAFPTKPGTSQPWTVQDVLDAKVFYEQTAIATQLPKAKLTEIVLVVTVVRQR